MNKEIILLLALSFVFSALARTPTKPTDQTEYLEAIRQQWERESKPQPLPVIPMQRFTPTQTLPLKKEKQKVEPLIIPSTQFPVFQSHDPNSPSSKKELSDLFTETRRCMTRFAILSKRSGERDVKYLTMDLVNTCGDALVKRISKDGKSLEEAYQVADQLALEVTQE